MRLVLTMSAPLAEQALAQVVADRPGAHARALGQLAHLQQRALGGRSAAGGCSTGAGPAHARKPALGPARLGRPGRGAGGQQLRRPPPRSSPLRAAPPRCARPAPGPGRRACSPGCASSLTGTPSWRTGARRPGCSISTTISRSRTSSEESASSSSSTGSRQQSCSRANASHSARVRAGRSPRPAACASEPGRSNCARIRSSRPTPRHQACQNFGSSAPSETQPSAHSYGR